MKKIVVASTNPVKIKATLEGFKRMFPDQEFEAEGISAESGVKDQPTNDEETFLGAMNRASNARKAVSNADYYVGLEGGIEAKGAEMESYAWIVVMSKEGKVGKGRTSVFFLPPRVAALIEEGKELGEADDIVFGKTNSKQANGAVGILTHDVIQRSDYYSEAIIFALIPFKNPTLY
ncbi:MAG TPA: inosine/xanthosine triphosphatase [Patescibacteria group bacterium]|nr:inosine/xanthosine triphosphatase [Patescibacteria group bacterium]